MLKGKHIIVGITGSIAAYKAASLVRLLVKEMRPFSCVNKTRTLSNKNISGWSCSKNFA